jgi:hypothetical protein
VTAVRLPSRPTSHAGVARTRAATTANLRRAAGRTAQELAARLEYLDDERVAALAAVLVAEALARGLAVRDLR